MRSDSSDFLSSRRVEVGGGGFRFLPRTCDVALDADQILVDLRQLIAQRRCLAQQLEHLLAVDFDGALAFADETLERLALFVLDCKGRSGSFYSLLQLDQALRVGIQFELAIDAALFEILRFGFALREALSMEPI